MSVSFVVGPVSTNGSASPGSKGSAGRYWPQLDTSLLLLMDQRSGGRGTERDSGGRGKQTFCQALSDTLFHPVKRMPSRTVPALSSQPSYVSPLSQLPGLALDHSRKPPVGAPSPCQRRSGLSLEVLIHEESATNLG